MPQRESLCQRSYEQSCIMTVVPCVNLCRGPTIELQALSQIHLKTPNVGRLSLMKCMATYIFATESMLLACLIFQCLVFYFVSSCKSQAPQGR